MVSGYGKYIDSIEVARTNSKVTGHTSDRVITTPTPENIPVTLDRSLQTIEETGEAGCLSDLAGDKCSPSTELAKASVYIFDISGRNLRGEHSGTFKQDKPRLSLYMYRSTSKDGTPQIAIEQQSPTPDTLSL